MTPVFKNEKNVPVPEELYPLEGSVTVPIILTPKQFDAFWQRIQEEDEGSSHHAVLDTYKTRLPLILQADLKIAGQSVDLPDDPMELLDQAIAPFVVSATQECVNRATRLPILPKPSKNGTKA